MKRKLTVAILLSLSAASPVALALGLGDTDVNSTLNAPLRASIPLTDVAGLDPDLLNVSVADESSFSAAGLSRTPLAASVRASVQQRGGQLVLDLVTERPVREPWVDLLLRFDWPGGQQLREVTLLFDPPDYDQMPALIGPARTASATASVQAPPPTPREVPQAQPVAQPAASPQPDDPAWIRNGDTLWSVAGRLRPDSGISMNQMMVSLVQANPEVFPSGNINAMRAGFTLVVPEREAIAQRSSTEADRIVQAMNQAWANRGSGAPARVALGTPDDSASGSAVATASTPLPADSGDATSTADASADVEEANLPEDATPSDASQEADGPRLTLLTDADLAAEADISGEGALSLQGEGDAQQGDDAGSGESGRQRVDIDPELLQALHGETLNGEGDLTSDERLVRLENRWIESQQALETVRNERDELQASLGEMRDQMEAMRDQLAALTAGGQGADVPGAGDVAMPSGEAENPPETPWWGALYKGALDRSLLLAGAGLAALLALWALLRFRRREDTYQEATFGQVRTVGMGDAGVVTPGSTGVSTVNAPSEQVPIRASMPQAEAINEADIFIAYGRFDQARELLQASLEQDPERDDLRLKLLMVHLEQGDYEAADRQASTLKAGGDPAVLEETERLMNRRLAARSNPVSPSADSSPAVFSASQELPPRLFDEPGDASSDLADTSNASSNESSAEPATSDARDPRASYRRPEGSTPEATASDPEEDSLESQEPARLFEAPADVPLSSLATQAPRESNDPAVTDEVGAGVDVSGDSGINDQENTPAAFAETEASLPDPEPPAEPAPAPPELKTRRADDGRDIIDYQPPTLDPSPARREETPMQPSVDFTSSSSDSPLAEAKEDAQPSTGSRSAGKGPMDSPDEWEVEEVAFPPLDMDNTAFSTPSSSTDTLAEARRLLDSGQSHRARRLLESLAGAGDPAIEEEVQALISRYDL